MSAVYQSEEVSRLKQQRRLSQQPEFTHEPMTEPMTRSMINGADGLKHQYTVSLCKSISTPVLRF